MTLPMQMIRAQCAPCGNVFDLVSAPMPIVTWAETAERRAVCPLCGSSGKHVTLGAQRPLTEQEAACKRRFEAASKQEQQPERVANDTRR